MAKEKSTSSRQRIKINKVFKLFFLGAISLFSFVSTCAQTKIDYSPEPITDTIPEAIHEYLKENLKTTKQRLSEEKNKISEFAGDIYERQFDYVVKAFNNDYFITEGYLANHINGITKKILLANPEIESEIFVIPYRSDDVNVLSYGNGLIALMLGLLNRIENDDHLAFIICHEIAHHYLNHTHKRILDVARLNFDKELRKKFNAARRSEYNTYTKLKDLMTSVELSLSKYGQRHEFEADSLGLIFMTQAGFNPSSSIQVMRILDNADKPINPALINLESQLTSPAFPGKSSWFIYTKSTTWHKSVELPDSAKTHPSCAVREQALRRQLLSASLDTTSQVTSSEYPVQEKSWFELAESHYHLKSYGKALFVSLLLLEENPNNAYLQGMTGKSLFQIYVHQKKHELGKVVSLPDPRFPENYDRVLTFIHLLRLSELASVSYNYLTTRPIQNLTNEHVLYALWLVSFLDISALNPDSIKADYMEKYPNGRYVAEFKKAIKF